jgi:hypothetical protein
MWLEHKCGQAAQQLGELIPRPLVDVLQHIILSHHGELEYGSPKTPATPEAFAVHMIENMDAKLTLMLMATRGEAAAGAEGNWTEYMKAVNGRLYRPDVAPPDMGMPDHAMADDAVADDAPEHSPAAGDGAAAVGAAMGGDGRGGGRRGRQAVRLDSRDGQVRRPADGRPAGRHQPAVRLVGLPPAVRARAGPSTTSTNARPSRTIVSPHTNVPPARTRRVRPDECHVPPARGACPLTPVSRAFAERRFRQRAAGDPHSWGHHRARRSSRAETAFCAPPANRAFQSYKLPPDVLRTFQLTYKPLRRKIVSEHIGTDRGTGLRLGGLRDGAGMASRV